jgi:uncharacterized protein YqhQ
MAEKKVINVGGQAVIEGVMMRGADNLATAIRRKDGSIELYKQPFTSITSRNKILGLPLIRGFISLIEMMLIVLRRLHSVPIALNTTCSKKSGKRARRPRKRLRLRKRQRSYLAMSLPLG